MDLKKSEDFPKDSPAKAALLCKIRGTKYSSSSTKVQKCDVNLRSSRKRKGQCARPAGQKNVKIDTNSVIPRRDLAVSPVDFVFSIDHIIEEVFRTLEAADLQRCRLISHRWNSFAVFPLHKHLQVQVNGNGLERNSDKSLREFVMLLKQNSKLFPSPFTPFPCNTFSFEKHCDETLTFTNEEIFSNLMSLHGHSMRTVSIKFVNKFGSLSNNSFKGIIREQIKNLVLNQLPNVHTLKLDMLISRDGIIGRGPMHRKSSRMGKSFEIGTDQVNSNLKVVHLPSAQGAAISRSFSLKIMDLLIKIAPNLEEIATNYNNRGCYMYYFEPLQRIDLLKTIDLLLRQLDDLILFEKIIEHTTSKNNSKLGLRSLSISLQASDFQHDGVFGSPGMKSRIATVINTILEQSTDSLETCDWDHVTVLPEFKFPLAMPKVRKVCLSNPFCMSEGDSLFPPTFCWTETFPSLRCLQIYQESPVSVDLMDFINSLGGELRTRRKNKLRIEMSIVGGCVELCEMQEIQSRFPSAVVQEVIL